jgi:hypothetical protein
MDLRKVSGFALYIINCLFFITSVKTVYSAVRTDCLYKADCVSSLYIISRLVFITVVESVYSAVRTGSLSKADYVSTLKG